MDQLLSELEQAKKEDDTMKIIELQNKYIQLLENKNENLGKEIFKLWQKITKLLKLI